MNISFFVAMLTKRGSVQWTSGYSLEYMMESQWFGFSALPASITENKQLSGFF